MMLRLQRHLISFFPDLKKFQQRTQEEINNCAVGTILVFECKVCEVPRLHVKKEDNSWECIFHDKE